MFAQNIFISLTSRRCFLFSKNFWFPKLRGHFLHQLFPFNKLDQNENSLAWPPKGGWYLTFFQDLVLVHTWSISPLFFIFSFCLRLWCWENKQWMIWTLEGGTQQCTISKPFKCTFKDCDLNFNFTYSKLIIQSQRSTNSWFHRLQPTLSIV